MLPILPALLTMSGCWFFIGDPVVVAGIQAYAPRQSTELTARTLHEAMTSAGFARIRPLATEYLIDGRLMTFATYEATYCKPKTAEGRRRCMVEFSERAVPLATDETLADGEIHMTYLLPESRADFSTTVVRHKSGAIACVAFSDFGTSEFDPDTKAGISRLRAALIERFGEKFVANVPCRGTSEVYWPG